MNQWKRVKEILIILLTFFVGILNIAIASNHATAELHISLNQKQSYEVVTGDAKEVDGLHGKGRQINREERPLAIALPKGTLNMDQGSISIWWRPEWNREETHKRFGVPGSLQRGFYASPLDRRFHSDHWHQLVTTWNKNNVVRHYVDGELLVRETRRPEAFPEQPWIWLGGNTVWQISPNGSSPPKGPDWAVTVDELQTSRRVLSDDEIQQDYLKGAIASRQMNPGQALANRVIDLRLGNKRMIGSRNQPMYGFPSIGKGPQGDLYLKAKLGGENNQGNRWNRSTNGGRSWEPIATESSIAITKTLNGVKTKDGSRIAPDFHLVIGGGQADKDALILKKGMKQGVLRTVAADGSALPTIPITAEPPFEKGQFNIAGWITSPQVLRSQDGGMLTLMFHLQPESEHTATLWLMKSSEDGRTWKPLSEVSKRSPLFREGLNEATLLRGKDESLICLARTGLAMVTVRSTDDGQTWQPWKYLGVDGVAPHAIPLASGLKLCAYGRPDVNLLISLDENATEWDAPFLLHNANRTPHNFLGDWHQNGTFYVDPVEVEPGRVLVIYDTGGEASPHDHLPQNRLWLQEVLVDSVNEFDKVRTERLAIGNDRLKLLGDWNISGDESSKTPFASTREDAEVRFSFVGTGLVGQLMLIPDGGDIEVWVDGQRERVLNTAASHTHWLARRILARDLKPGHHAARIVVRCPQLPRPLLPSIQELMRTNHVETIRDSQGKTRVVLHAIEVINENGQQIDTRDKSQSLQQEKDTTDKTIIDKRVFNPPTIDGTVNVSGLKLDHNEVLFHANFDKSTEPTIAPQGNLTSQFRRPGPITAEDGTAFERDQPVFRNGIRGQSLALRSNQGTADALLWSLPKTTVPQEGTLFFWFRPQWPSHEVGRVGARTLLNFTPFPAIRKWERLHFAAFHTAAYHIRGRHAVPWGRFWKPETWHLMAVSWTTNHTQRLYFDGELVAMTEGKPPTQREGFAIALTGEAEMDIDDLTLLSRRLTQSEVESCYVSGLHSQSKLIDPSPAIRVQVGQPVEVAGQQARGFNQLIRFPKLFRQQDGSILLRSDNRNISLHFFDARDAVVPAGKDLRWFQSDQHGATWKEITIPDQVARHEYIGKEGGSLFVEETAQHQGNGVYETTFRKGTIVPARTESNELLKAEFHAGIEPSATVDNRLYLNRSSVLTSDGKILISGFIRPKDRWKSHLLIFSSNDEGHSWHRISDVWKDNRFPDHVSSPVNGAPPLFGPTQASLLRTSNDRILMVFRTDAALLACDSVDEGRTWSEPWMVGPEGANPTLVQSGELIALSYGRPDVNIAFSADHGKSWFGYTDLLPSDRTAVEASNVVGPLGYSYKPGTGHVALLPKGSGTFLMAHDTNWISDPKHELPRASLWVTPLSVSHKQTPKSARFISATDSSVQKNGKWVGGAKSVPYLSSDDDKGWLLFTFEGTGISLVHPTGFDGGRLRVLIDRKDVTPVNLRTPQSWWGRRTLLAEGLPPGKHIVELVTDIQAKRRAPLMPDRWPGYEPHYPALFDAVGQTRAFVHGFEVWE